MWSRTVRVIVTVSLGILAALLAADAQPRRNIPVIGVLANADLSAALANPKSHVSAFRQGLRDMGYVEGQNIDIEYRPLGGKQALLSILAAELVRLKVDVLVTFGALPTRAAREETTTIPIVFACTFDPVEQGLVGSLAQPGGNITGTAGTTQGLTGKQFELLKEVAPAATRVAALKDPTHPLYEASTTRLQAVTRSLGMDLHLVAVRDPATELERAFAALVHERVDAIYIEPNPTFPPYHAQIVNLVAKRELPAIYPVRLYVVAGGLMSYEADCPVLAQRAGNFVGKILQGAKPADLPVELPMKYHLAINVKTAQALGITIPPSLLVLADEVIQ
jgi:putative tryptophan/tyrosine transport system substrate-binding protein